MASPIDHSEPVVNEDQLDVSASQMTIRKRNHKSPELAQADKSSQSYPSPPSLVSLGPKTDPTSSAALADPSMASDSGYGTYTNADESSIYDSIENPQDLEPREFGNEKAHEATAVPEANQEKLDSATAVQALVSVGSFVVTTQIPQTKEVLDEEEANLTLEDDVLAALPRLLETKPDTGQVLARADSEFRPSVRFRPAWFGSFLVIGLGLFSLTFLPCCLDAQVVTFASSILMVLETNFVAWISVAPAELLIVLFLFVCAVAFVIWTWLGCEYYAVNVQIQGGWYDAIADCGGENLISSGLAARLGLQVVRTPTPIRLPTGYVYVSPGWVRLHFSFFLDPITHTEVFYIIGDDSQVTLSFGHNALHKYNLNPIEPDHRIRRRFCTLSRALWVNLVPNNTRTFLRISMPKVTGLEISVEALLDDGFKYNAIALSYLAENCPRGILSSRKLYLRDFRGNLIKIITAIDIKVKLGQNSKVITFLVIPDLVVPAILGRDFQKMHRRNPDFTKAKFMKAIDSEGIEPSAAYHLAGVQLGPIGNFFKNLLQKSKSQPEPSAVAAVEAQRHQEDRDEVKRYQSECSRIEQLIGAERDAATQTNEDRHRQWTMERAKLTKIIKELQNHNQPVVQRLTPVQNATNDGEAALAAAAHAQQAAADVPLQENTNITNAPEVGSSLQGATTEVDPNNNATVNEGQPADAAADQTVRDDTMTGALVHTIESTASDDPGAPKSAESQTINATTAGAAAPQLLAAGNAAPAEENKEMLAAAHGSQMNGSLAGILQGGPANVVVPTVAAVTA